MPSEEETLPAQPFASLAALLAAGWTSGELVNVRHFEPYLDVNGEKYRATDPDGTFRSYYRRAFIAFDSDGVARYTYCINSMTDFEDLDSTYTAYAPDLSAYYNSLPEEARLGIMLTLLFGYHSGGAGYAPFPQEVATSVNGGDWAMATQTLLWEYERGFRTLERRTSDRYYQELRGRSAQIYYDWIVEKSQAYYRKLSFTETEKSAAETRTMSWTDGAYRLTLTDTNETLADITLSDERIRVTRDGNRYTFTAEEALPGPVLLTVKKDPAAYGANTVTPTSFLIYENAGVQTTAGGAEDRLEWYLRLDTERAGTLSLTKASSLPGLTDGNACYDLKNTVYGVFADEEAAEQAKVLALALCGRIGAQDDRAEHLQQAGEILENTGAVAALYLDSGGTAHTQAGGKGPTALTLEAGTYYVTEILAGKGYALNGRSHRANVQPGQAAEVQTRDEPLYGGAGFSLVKKAKTGIPDPSRLPDLTGAVFTVKYYDGYYTAKTLPKQAARTWTFRTRAHGDEARFSFAEAGSDLAAGSDALFLDAAGKAVLPLGTVTIEETAAPAGYVLETAVIRSASGGEAAAGKAFLTQILPDGTAAAPADGERYEACDEPVFGGLQVIKADRELGGSEALGGASLAGIRFEVRNASAHSVILKDASGAEREVPAGEKVPLDFDGCEDGCLVTAWNEAEGRYTAQTTKTALSAGRYRVREVRTNGSYLLTDGTERLFEISGETAGEYARNPEDPSESGRIFYDRVRRCDVSFEKKLGPSMTAGAGIAFVFTCLETGERHVVVTDENGLFSSEGRHTERTNANDALLDEAGEQREAVIRTEDLDAGAGVWFGRGEAGGEAPAAEDLRAFPYGRYSIRELRCEGNEGYALLGAEMPVVLTVRKDDALIRFGTLDDLPAETPAVRTAFTAESGRKELPAGGSGSLTFTDRIEYEHFAPGRYEITMTVMDRTSGEPLSDPDGAPYRAVCIQELSGSGTAEVSLEIDLARITGDLVAFEEIRPEGEEELYAEHRDLADDGQTVTLLPEESSSEESSTPEESSSEESSSEEPTTPGESSSEVPSTPEESSSPAESLPEETETPAETTVPETPAGTVPADRKETKKEIVQTGDRGTDLVYAAAAVLGGLCAGLVLLLAGRKKGGRS